MEGWRKEEQASPFLLDHWGDEKHEHALAYDVEEWLDHCKEHTFASVSIPLSMEEAEQIISVYSSHVRSNKQITPDLEQKMEEIAQRMDIAMAQIKEEAPAEFRSGFFVRLSSRSPKDAGFDTDYKNRMAQLLLKHMSEHPIQEYYSQAEIETMKSSDLSNVQRPTMMGNEEWQKHKLVDDELLNSLLVANYHSNLYYQALSDILCVQNGAEAVQLLTRSERTYNDLIYEGKYPETWKMQIILRQWDRRVRLDHEFRVFVSCGTISAISQYNPYSYYPGLYNEKVRETLEGRNSNWQHRMRSGGALWSTMT